MRIIDKYILKHFLQPLFYCIILFVFLYIVIDLFENLNDIINNHLDIPTVLLYFATNIPTVFVQTMPVAMLVATIYSLGNFNKYNEITAMRASGLSFLKILLPLTIIGFAASVLVFIVSDSIVPRTAIVNSMIRDEKMKSGKANKPKTIENLALYGKKNRLIFIKSFDIEKNMLEEIIIQENDESANLIGKISAQEAIWENGDWNFKNCTIYKLKPSGEIIGEPEFYNEKIIDMYETPKELAKREWRAEFMNYGELKTYINQFSKGSFKTIRKLKVDLEHKVAFPFTSLIVIFAASPFALISRRGGALIGLGLSLLMGLAYYAVMSISLALGKTGALSPFIAAWLANVIFLGIGLYLIRKIS